MGPDVLKANLALTLKAMKAQTGKEPGMLTGLCHPVFVGALRGGPPEFNESFSTKEQLALEEHHGIATYPVFVRASRTIHEIMPQLLEQRRVQADAVVVFGHVRNYRRNHVVAVVPEDGNPPYHIVDSLLPNATTLFDTAAKVGKFINQRFRHKDRDIYIVPTREEHEKRTGKETLLVAGKDIILIAPRYH